MARSGLDRDRQGELLKLIEKSNRTVTLETIAELADTVRASESNSVTQCTLFGFEQFNQSTAIQRAEVQAQVKKQLRREVRLFKTVSSQRNAEHLEKGNNQIDRYSSQSISSRAEQTLHYFDLLKNQRGPVSDAINNCVTQLLDGVGRSVAIAKCLEVIHQSASWLNSA